MVVSSVLQCSDQSLWFCLIRTWVFHAPCTAQTVADHAHDLRWHFFFLNDKCVMCFEQSYFKNMVALDLCFRDVEEGISVKNQ